MECNACYRNFNENSSKTSVTFYLRAFVLMIKVLKISNVLRSSRFVIIEYIFFFRHWRNLASVKHLPDIQIFRDLQGKRKFSLIKLFRKRLLKLTRKGRRLRHQLRLSHIYQQKSLRSLSYVTVLLPISFTTTCQVILSSWGRSVIQKCKTAEVHNITNFIVSR